ncbi:PTS ascorbate transporter subunit IIB, partial [Staphylococcus pseudintermedius]
IHELEGRTSSKLLGLENLMDDQEIKENLKTVI